MFALKLLLRNSTVGCKVTSKANKVNFKLKGHRCIFKDNEQQISSKVLNYLLVLIQFIITRSCCVFFFNFFQSYFSFQAFSVSRKLYKTALEFAILSNKSPLPITPGPLTFKGYHKKNNYIERSSYRGKGTENDQIGEKIRQSLQLLV